MDLATPTLGFVAGLLGTAAMLPVELYGYRRWGLRGVFEWHEVQASLWGFQTQRPFGAAGFAVHAAFGGVAGAAALVMFEFLGLPQLWFSVALGLALWIGTVLVHEWATTVNPWRNEMGRGPVVASLTGHLLYGLVLGFAVLILLRELP